MNLKPLMMQAVISCLGITLFGLPGNALFAQNKTTRLDSLFTTLAGLYEFNGNVLVAENGRTVYSHSFGFADAENHMAATENTAFILLDNVTHRGLHPEGLNAFYLLNGGPVFRDKKSLAKIYIATLYAQGTDKAVQVFNQLRADTVHYFINERELNQLAYDLKGDGFKAQALEAFKLNVQLFLSSYNTYDSYADALADSGKKEEAIQMYKRSMELNPANKDGLEALQRLEN